MQIKRSYFGEDTDPKKLPNLFSTPIRDMPIFMASVMYKNHTYCNFNVMVIQGSCSLDSSVATALSVQLILQSLLTNDYFHRLKTFDVLLIL